MAIKQVCEFYQILEEELVSKGYQPNPDMPNNMVDENNHLMTLYAALDKNEKLASEDGLIKALGIVADKIRGFFEITDIAHIKAHESEKKILIEVDFSF